VVLIPVIAKIYLEQKLAKLFAVLIVAVLVVNADLWRQNVKFSGVVLIIHVLMMSTIMIPGAFQFPGHPE
jgi:hypothetical protein